MAERSQERRAGRAVRSFREVFQIERRLFRVDRWRIPVRSGVEVRAIVYALACYAALLVARVIPPVAALHDLLPAPIGWLILPAGGALALARFRPDGRIPHHAAWSVTRWVLSARRVAGLRPDRQVGVVGLVESEVVVCSDWRDGTASLHGDVVGPARVTARRAARLSSAKRGAVLVLDLAGPALRRGAVLDLGEGERIEVRS
jgi:hypothetical protein